MLDINLLKKKLIELHRKYGYSIFIKDPQGNIILDLLKTEKSKYRGRNCQLYTFDDLIGTSLQITSAKNIARLAAKVESPVLICGESGTGKEIFAQAIHSASKRANYPFIALNCGAIPKDLIESELFGYAPYAFTGASKYGKPGKFEEAQNGTLFLDEIAEMSPLLQTKLLRILQEKTIQKIGDSRQIKINTRIIAATNKDIELAVKKGEFRADLYYRLNVLRINVPPLRNRKSDILKLANYFIKKYVKMYNLPEKVISPQLKKALLEYSWPGNVRELQNIIEREVILCKSKNLSHVPDCLSAPVKLSIPPDSMNLEELEKKTIEQALIRTNYSIKKASLLLGISRATFYRKISKYQIPYKKNKTQRR